MFSWEWTKVGQPPYRLTWITRSDRTVCIAVQWHFEWSTNSREFLMFLFSLATELKWAWNNARILEDKTFSINKIWTPSQIVQLWMGARLTHIWSDCDARIQFELVRIRDGKHQNTKQIMSQHRSIYLENPGRFGDRAWSRLKSQNVYLPRGVAMKRADLPYTC